MLKDKGPGHRDFVCLTVDPVNWFNDTSMSVISWTPGIPVIRDDLPVLVWQIKLKQAKYQAGRKNRPDILNYFQNRGGLLTAPEKTAYTRNLRA
ncbi:MAG: hypothetical protein PHU23_00665 [Dehalococcoidales bacterium]|nr:hypothetical protein [Dehalococcoidales bacterium]